MIRKWLCLVIAVIAATATADNCPLLGSTLGHELWLAAVTGTEAAAL